MITTDLLTIVRNNINGFFIFSFLFKGEIVKVRYGTMKYDSVHTSPLQLKEEICELIHFSLIQQFNVHIDISDIIEVFNNRPK